MKKTWLITGSAGGLGLALAEHVLEQGDRVVATARAIERLSDLQGRYPGNLALFELDVTDSDRCAAAVEVAVSTFGGIDVLVNNAGYAHVAPFEQTSVEDFKAEIDTNFFGVVNMTRAVLPSMRLQRSGHVINISSSAGRFGAAGVAAYCAAKFAVGGFTEALAREIAPFGVKAVSVEPGSMRTNWTRVARSAVPELLPEYEATVGMVMKMTEDFAGHEPGDPRKVAGVIFTLSRCETVPEHLVLGSDALSTLAAEEASRADAAMLWNATSRSTGFD